MLLASPVRRVGVNPRWGIPNTLTVNDLKLLQLSHQLCQWQLLQLSHQLRHSTCLHRHGSHICSRILPRDKERARPVGALQGLLGSTRLRPRAGTRKNTTRPSYLHSLYLGARPRCPRGPLTTFKQPHQPGLHWTGRQSLVPLPKALVAGLVKASIPWGPEDQAQAAPTR